MLLYRNTFCAPPHLYNVKFKVILHQNTHLCITYCQELSLELVMRLFLVQSFVFCVVLYECFIILFRDQHLGCSTLNDEENAYIAPTNGRSRIENTSSLQ